MHKTAPSTVASVPHRILVALQREARRKHNQDFYRILVAEAISRRWFLARGLPSWRTDQYPSDEGRYSLLFPGGRRAAVSLPEENRISFDAMAKAKCDYLLKVEMKDEISGFVKGFFFLHDIRRQGNLLWKPELSILETRPMEEFPELLKRPGGFRLSYFLNSIRILFRGDLETPPPLECGLHGQNG